MATLGSKTVKVVVVPPNATKDGKELLVEFQNGLATVPKIVKRFLLEKSPDLYYDPLMGDNTGKKFGSDYDALEYYIEKIKRTGSVPKLVSLLKGHYETLQGELMSGKYNVRAEEPKKIKKEAKVSEEDSEDDEALATGAGDKIKSKKE